MKNNPLRQCWRDMLERCYNPKRWKYHGAKGITVVPEWHDFAIFECDMGPSYPGKGWTLDRKKNEKGYSKENCRWATRVEQSRNRASNKLSALTCEEIRDRYDPDITSYRKLATEYNVSYEAIRRAVNGTIWT